MASVVDICNLALARLGDNATVSSISPPEGSAQADHCARFYPIALDSLLEMHAWKFAIRRTLLAQLVTDAWGWSFAYAMPSGVLKVIGVLPGSGSSDGAAQPYEIEAGEGGGMVILTNQEDASLRYVAHVTDTTTFSPLFIDALAWLLAAYLAGPLIKGDAGAAMARACLQSFQVVLSGAKVSDANQRKIDLDHQPTWIAGR